MSVKKASKDLAHTKRFVIVDVAVVYVEVEEEDGGGPKRWVNVDKRDSAQTFEFNTVAASLQLPSALNGTFASFHRLFRSPMPDREVPMRHRSTRRCVFRKHVSFP